MKTLKNDTFITRKNVFLFTLNLMAFIEQIIIDSIMNLLQIFMSGMNSDVSKLIYFFKSDLKINLLFREIRGYNVLWCGLVI